MFKYTSTKQHSNNTQIRNTHVLNKHNTNTSRFVFIGFRFRFALRGPRCRNRSGSDFLWGHSQSMCPALVHPIPCLWVCACACLCVTVCGHVCAQFPSAAEASVIPKLERFRLIARRVWVTFTGHVWSGSAVVHDVVLFYEVKSQRAATERPVPRNRK